MQKKIETARYWLLISLAFAAPMSFTPSFPLPMFNFPSFRIGLYQILAVLFVITCVPLFRKGFRSLSNSRWFLASTLLLAGTLSIGLATTSTFARTVLYSASLVALLIFGISGYLAWRKLTKEQIHTTFMTLLWSGIVFGSLAVLQLVVASFDKTALGTLCMGCSDAVFGFPRINLFAAEPQFFANSLLPAFFAGFFFRKNKRLANWSIVLTSLAIGLTFSRGALLAIAVAITSYFVFQLFHKKPVASLLRLGCIACISILAAFGLLIGSATLRYHDTPYITFNTAVSMLDHLSLGKINIPQKTIETKQAEQENDASDFTPEGYVAASSNDRLSAASLALSAWNDSLKNMLFGVGMGNLGAYVNEYVASAPSNLTVYIWYILVLAELGLAGLVGVLMPAFYILSRLLTAKNILVPFIFTVTVAFLVQLFSFGSYINVMYLYLFFGLFVAMFQGTSALRTP